MKSYVSHLSPCKTHTPILTLTHPILTSNDNLSSLNGSKGLFFAIPSTLIFPIRSYKFHLNVSSSHFDSNHLSITKNSFQNSFRVNKNNSNSSVAASRESSTSTSPLAESNLTKNPGSGEVLLTVENLSKTYDGIHTLFENFNFTLQRGQKIGILGKNGSGKSTLLKILAGMESSDNGNVQIKKDVKIGYLPQDPKLNDESTIMESILSSDSPIISAARDYENLLRRQSRVISNSDTIKFESEYQKAFEKMERLKAWDCVNETKKYLQVLGLADFSDSSVLSLSGGQKKRIALISVLISNPDVLILDEPTNHMDIEMIEWMEKQFIIPNMTLILVSHDRYFLDKLCTEMIEMDKGKHYRHFGNYSNFLYSKEKRLLDKEKEVSRIETVLKREAEWMKKQPKARSTKSRSRIDNFYSLTQKSEREKDEKSIQFEIGRSRLGDKIMTVKNASLYWDEKIIFKKFFYEFEKGEKIGIVGKNGVGKSSFLDVLAGKLNLNEGIREAGETLVIGYFTQDVPEISEEIRAIDYIKQFGDRIQIEKSPKFKSNSNSNSTANSDSILSASDLLERFGFNKIKQYDWVSKLSGGERKRLFLASILIQKPNFLIMDEPTNDLDLDTIEILESFLQNFDGCTVIVSHDRRFMDKIVNKLFLLEGNGNIQLYDGHYIEFMEEIGLNDEKKDKEKNEIQMKKSLENFGDVVIKTDQNLEKKNKRKLTYMEKKEYQKIEGEMEKLSKKKDEMEIEIEKEMKNEGNDYEKMNILSQKLADLMLAIDSKTERWLELAEIAEMAE